MYALNKDMGNVGVAFEVIPDGRSAPPSWRKVTGHLIWDNKMDFTRESRWVLDGHTTPTPIHSTYAGFVSQERKTLIYKRLYLAKTISYVGMSLA